MKKYTKPSCEIIPADAEILGMSLAIYNYGDEHRNDQNLDDYYVTDGSQVLVPQHKKNKLWDDEED